MSRRQRRTQKAIGRGRANILAPQLVTWDAPLAPGVAGALLRSHGLDDCSDLVLLMKRVKAIVDDVAALSQAFTTNINAVVLTAPRGEDGVPLIDTAEEVQTIINICLNVLKVHASSKAYGNPVVSLDEDRAFTLPLDQAKALGLPTTEEEARARGMWAGEEVAKKS